MRALSHRSKHPENIWGNLFAINLFFGFLDIIETRAGQNRFTDHPPSQSRAANLRSVVSEICEMPAGFEKDYDSQKGLLKEWAKPPDES